MGVSAGSLANLSLLGQGLGTVTSAFGAASSASAQRTNLATQAAVAESNARISELGAQSELRAGQQRIAALTMKAGNMKGAQRAALAANGVAMGEGSAAEIQRSTDVLTAVDKAELEVASARAAFGQRAQASNYRQQAAMARANADAISPMSAFTSTLLGGGGRVAESWYRSSGTVSSSGTLTGNGDALGAFIELNNGWR